MFAPAVEAHALGLDCPDLHGNEVETCGGGLKTREQPSCLDSLFRVVVLIDQLFKIEGGNTYVGVDRYVWVILFCCHDSTINMVERFFQGSFL